jgi:TonB family protein
MNSRFATNLADEGFSVFVGAAITLVLFTAMAYFERGKESRALPEFGNMHAIPIPLELPPPPQIQPEVQPVGLTVTGIEVAAAESPVHIGVSVPVLDVVPVPLAPPAKIQVSALHAEFKPKMDLSTDFQHIFQQTEVDQRPTVLVESIPSIPRYVRKNAETLRVVMLMVIDAKGTASNLRVLNSSGNAEFDAIILRCVQDEWVFTPAIKKGRKVKCLVQRSITIKWSMSPFEP